MSRPDVLAPLAVRPGSGPARARAALLALLVLAWAVSACSAAAGRDSEATGATPVAPTAPPATTAPATSDPPRRVIVVGDSLVFAGGYWIGKAVAGRGGQVVFQEGDIGWTTTQLRPVAEHAIDTVPADVLVFESGSNDLRDSMFTPDPAVALERFGVDRDAVLDKARSQGLCVVGLEVALRNDMKGFLSFGPSWNRAAAAAFTTRSGVWVEWQRISSDHPEWFVEDGLHHTALGSEAFAEAMAYGAWICHTP